MESDRVAGVGRSDVAWRGSGSGRYHRITLRCGGGSGKHHRGCPSGGLHDRKDPRRNQHVQRADSLWNGHSEQNLSLSGRPWNAGDPSKSSGNQHYHLCERTGSTAAVTGKQLYRDGNRGQYNDDSFSAWDGCVLCLLHSVCGARRPARISPGKRSGTAGEGICLHLSGKVQLPGRRYHQRHGGYGNL